LNISRDPGGEDFLMRIRRTNSGHHKVSCIVYICM